MRTAVIQDVDGLRQYLKASAPWIAQTHAVLPSGNALLDRLLDGGFPKGALTVLTGLLGAGRMTIAAKLLARETKAGRPVAWVDAQRTLYPPALALEGVDLSRLLMVRASQSRGVFAMQQIIDSGAFSVVVASGLERELGSASVRRAQTASAGRGVSTILIVDPQTSASITHAALKLRVIRRSPGVLVEVEKSRSQLLGKRALIDRAGS